MTKQSMVSAYVRQARGLQHMANRLNRWGRFNQAAAYRDMAIDAIRLARHARNLMS